MLITSLRMEGLRFAPDLTLAELGRVVRVPAPPVGVAVADALSLLAATLSPGRFDTEAERLGLKLAESADACVLEDGLVVQAAFDDPGVVRSLLAPDSDGLIAIAVTIQLDPPLYGQLRTHALRDPRLAVALVEDGTLHIRVGWLFTRDRSVASISVFEVRLGSLPLPLVGSDRPLWLGDVLRAVGSRLGRVDSRPVAGSIAGRLMFASLSDDPVRREGARTLCGALGEPPFSLGRLELVRTERAVRACVGATLTDLRQYGPAALEAVALLEQVHVQRPDVLVVDALRDPSWVNWLASFTEGDDATLEQVFLIECPEGKV